MRFILAIVISSVSMLVRSTEEVISAPNEDITSRENKLREERKEFFRIINGSSKIHDANSKQKKNVKVIVQMKQQQTRKRDEDTAVNILLTQASMKIDSLGIYAIDLTYNELQKLQNDPNVQSIEPDSEVSILEEPMTVSAIKDHVRRLQEYVPWGIDEVLQDRNFWDNLTPNGTIKICVADTGYDLGHEDLPKAPDVIGSNNPAVSENWSYDGDGHGSHVAGTIAALGGNDKGTVGVIPNNKGGKFQLIIAKAFDKSGSGDESDILKAVESCRLNGANIISLSIGSSFYLDASAKMYQSLYDQGILIFAAAGNDGDSSYLYPASYSSVISIASVRPILVGSNFNQYNNQVELSGPGTYIYSTSKGNTYAALSGTSMATPHVSAVAGLLWMQFPTCTNQQIRNVLAKTSKAVEGNYDCTENTGFGVVQAVDAYDVLSRGDCGGFLNSTSSKGGCQQLDKYSISCTSSSNCDDNDPCTIDSCESGMCVSQINCSNCGKSEIVKVDIRPDLYPYEVTWEITKNNVNIMDGGPYAEAKIYSTSMCVDAGSYKFTIYDTDGDGICCVQGNGSYNITVGTTAIKSGGSFEWSESTNFTINPSTLPPTSPCKKYEKNLLIQFKPDKFSKRQNNFLIHKQNWAKTGWKLIKKIQPSSSSELMTYHICLNKWTCHRFRITDKKKNGICCENGEGWYNVHWGDEKLDHDPFIDGYAQTITFGNCD